MGYKPVFCDVHLEKGQGVHYPGSDRCDTKIRGPKVSYVLNQDKRLPNRIVLLKLDLVGLFIAFIKSLPRYGVFPMKVMTKITFLIVAACCTLQVRSAANEALATKFTAALKTAAASNTASHYVGSGTGAHAAAAATNSSSTSTTTATGVAPTAGSVMATVAGSSMAPVASAVDAPDGHHDPEDAKQAAARIAIQQTKKDIEHDKMLSSTQEFADLFAQVCTASTPLQPELSKIVSSYATLSPWVTHIIKAVHTREGRFVAYSKTGLLAVGSEGSVAFLNPDGTERATWTGGGRRHVIDLAWAPDDNALAVMLDFGEVVFLNPDGTVRSRHPRIVRGFASLAWAPNGSILAVGCRGGPSEGSVTFLNPSGTVRNTWAGVAKVGVASLTWAPDGSTLAVGLYNGNVVFLNPDGSIRNTWLGDAGNAVIFMVWEPNGGPLAVGLKNNDIVCLNPDSTICSKTSSTNKKPRIISLAFVPNVPDGSAWAAGLDNGDIIFSNSSVTQRINTIEGAHIEPIDWAPDGSTLAVALAGHDTICVLRPSAEPLDPILDDSVLDDALAEFEQGSVKESAAMAGHRAATQSAAAAAASSAPVIRVTIGNQTTASDATEETAATAAYRATLLSAVGSAGRTGMQPQQQTRQSATAQAYAKNATEQLTQSNLSTATAAVRRFGNDAIAGFYKMFLRDQRKNR